MLQLLQPLPRLLGVLLVLEQNPALLGDDGPPPRFEFLILDRSHSALPQNGRRMTLS